MHEFGCGKFGRHTYYFRPLPLPNEITSKDSIVFHVNDVNEILYKTLAALPENVRGDFRPHECIYADQIPTLTAIYNHADTGMVSLVEIELQNFKHARVNSLQRMQRKGKDVDLNDPQVIDQLIDHGDHKSSFGIKADATQYIYDTREPLDIKIRVSTSNGLDYIGYGKRFFEGECVISMDELTKGSVLKDLKDIIHSGKIPTSTYTSFAYLDKNAQAGSGSMYKRIPIEEYIRRRANGEFDFSNEDKKHRETIINNAKSEGRDTKELERKLTTKLVEPTR